MCDLHCPAATQLKTQKQKSSVCTQNPQKMNAAWSCGVVITRDDHIQVSNATEAQLIKQGGEL